MGFLDMFRKTELNPDDIAVDINENGMIINNMAVDIPTHITALEKILGKPRKVVYPKDENNASERINYAWDNLGLCCYTNGGKTVFCLEIRLNKGDNCPKHYPSKFFGGKVTIKGKPWLEAVKNAPPTPIAPGEPEFFREITLGNYNALAEYVDFMQDENTRTEKDFTTISVQLKDD